MKAAELITNPMQVKCKNARVSEAEVLPYSYQVNYPPQRAPQNTLHISENDGILPVHLPFNDGFLGVRTLPLASQMVNEI